MNKKQETKQKLKKALKTNWKKYSKRKNQTKNEMNMRNKKKTRNIFFFKRNKSGQKEMENKHIQKEEKEMERKKETLIAKRTRKKTYPSIHLKKIYSKMIFVFVRKLHQNGFLHLPFFNLNCLSLLKMEILTEQRYRNTSVGL